MTGTINNAIVLDVSAVLEDTDGSEEITSVVISDVPSTATLSAGTTTVTARHSGIERFDWLDHHVDR